ncbi:MAG: GNAT family N-acetyltransferase [Colwellia sp.]
MTIMLSVKIIDNIYDFHHFERSWEDFRTQENVNNLCLSWLWIELWCKYYLKKNDKLFIHIYYDNESIVGVFPVYLKKIMFGYQLRFLATGEPEESEICSEFQDFIVRDEYKKQAFMQFSADIKKQHSLISIALTNVLKGSKAKAWLCLYYPNGRCTINHSGMQYLLPVYETLNEQVAKLSSKTTRRQAKKYLSTLECYCMHIENEDMLIGFFNDLKELHNNSWHERGRKGVFENNIFYGFHLDYIKKCYQQGKLVLFKVVCKQGTVAIFYGIIDGEVLYYYQSGILRGNELPSAGIAMHIEALKFARVNNIKQYDLMKGSVDSYKKRMVKGGQEVINILTFKPNYIWLPFYWKIKSKIIASIKGKN